jgi:dihydroneopterin triphosphate diphosphatase
MQETRVPEIRADAVAVYVYRRTPLVEFLQIRRSAESGEYQGSWQTVYGGVHAGETAVQAAVRELKEETGLAPAAMWQVEYLESFYFMDKDYVVVMPVFAVEVGREAEVRLNEEHDGARWVAEARIDSAFMWRTQREALHILLEALRNPTGAREYLTVK